MHRCRGEGFCLAPSPYPTTVDPSQKGQDEEEEADEVASEDEEDSEEERRRLEKESRKAGQDKVRTWLATALTLDMSKYADDFIEAGVVSERRYAQLDFVLIVPSRNAANSATLICRIPLTTLLQ